MLDLIAGALGPQLSVLNLSSVRIDGSSSLQQRRDGLDKFNSESVCVIMLATIGVVGEGYVVSSLATYLTDRHSFLPCLGSCYCASSSVGGRNANAHAVITTGLT